MPTYSYMESGAIPSYHIHTWDAAGRPKRLVSKAYNLPARAQWKCICDLAREKGSSQSLRDAFFRECGTCGAQYRQNAGLQFSPSLQAFVGEGVVAPDAVTVSPVLPPLIGFGPGEDLLRSGDVSPIIPAPEQVPVQTSVVNAPELQAKSTSMDIGSYLGLVTSVCKGPYNYDSGSKMCIPKPDCKQRDPTDPCMAYPSGVGTMTTGPGIPGVTDPGFTGGTSPCPTGYEWDGSQCIKSGVSGTIQRTLPGGQTGTGADVYGQAVVGAFGRPAIEPYVESRPTRRCPPGTVLGKDNLCYQGLPRSFRKWPRAPRPLLTGGEMKVLRKADRLKAKVKKAATSSGFTCKKR